MPESGVQLGEERDKQASRWSVLGALLSLPKISASISKSELKQIESAVVDECGRSFFLFSLSFVCLFVCLFVLILLGLVGFEEARTLMKASGDPEILIEHLSLTSAMEFINLRLPKDPSYGLDILKRMQDKIMKKGIDSSSISFLAESLLHTPRGEEQKRVVDALFPALTSWADGVPIVENLLKSGAPEKALIFCTRLVCKTLLLFVVCCLCPSRLHRGLIRLFVCFGDC